MIVSRLLILLCVFGSIAQAQVNVNNLKIRVERAVRERKPEPSQTNNCYAGKDNYFNEIQIDASTYYGYTANGSKDPAISSTCRIRSGDPWGFNNVLYSPNPVDPNWFLQSIFPSDHYNASAAYGSCGLWLNGTYRSGSTYYGFAHAEAYSHKFADATHPECLYSPTTKSMALLSSTDGNSWNLVGQIIANPSMHSPGTSPSEYGEGDCNPIPFGSYLYLYCRRTADYKTSVARAPLTSDFSAVNWVKYNTNDGGWNATADNDWNGNDTPLMINGSPATLGSSASLWSTKSNLMLLTNTITPGVQGVKMSFSADATNFSPVAEPIIREDDNPWPTASGTSDMLVYPAVVDPNNGSRIWGSSGYFLLFYTFAPDKDDSAAGNSPNPAPNNGRTIVRRQVHVTDMGAAQSPQVGVAVARWANPDISLRISTTEAVPYNFDTGNLAYETNTGYIMTEPPGNGASIEIWECAHRSWPSSTNPDHIMVKAGSTECPDNNTSTTYRKVRSAGFLYDPNVTPPGNTIAVYRCKNTQAGYVTDTHFTSTDSSCEGLGTQEYKLGYALSN
jgi:hypothetical protein